MSALVAVHGAFRGSWYWQPLADELARSGHRVIAVDLAGTGTRSAPRPDDVTLEDWLDDVEHDVDSIGASDDIVLVGHSMGGVVAQAAAARLGPSIRQVVLLDSPLVVAGQRAVDVSGPAPPPPGQLPPRSLWIEPTAVGPDQGFDPGLANWVNVRLSAVPMGPQLDTVRTTSTVPTSMVFFDRTPDGYPSTFERRRCELARSEHHVLDLHHDAPILEPTQVAALLVDLLEP